MSVCYVGYADASGVRDGFPYPMTDVRGHFHVTNDRLVLEGITGVAGPGGGSEEKPVGTVWISVALDGDAVAERHRFTGDRGIIRARAAQAALATLYRRLSAPGAGP